VNALEVSGSQTVPDLEKHRAEKWDAEKGGEKENKGFPKERKLENLPSKNKNLAKDKCFRIQAKENHRSTKNVKRSKKRGAPEKTKRR